MNAVVTTRLDCFSPDGDHREVVVEIGQPYQAAEGEWACPVKIRGLYDHLCDIHGQDSLSPSPVSCSVARSIIADRVR